MLHNICVERTPINGGWFPVCRDDPRFHDLLLRMNLEP